MTISPKIFVISLQQAQERQKKIQAELGEIPFQFFWASDGRALTDDEKTLALSLHPKVMVGKKGCKMQKLASIYPKLLPGEVGCYLSHYRVLQKIYAENIAIAIILEDDVCIQKDFASLIQKFQDLIYHWDLIRLCGLRFRKFKIIAQISPLYQFVKLLNTACGAQGYAVTWQGAGKLLDLLEVMVHPVDITLDHYWNQNWAGGKQIAFYAIQPYPIMPAQLPSMIDSRPRERVQIKNHGLNWQKIQRLWLKHKKSWQKRWAIHHHQVKLKSHKKMGR